MAPFSGKRSCGDIDDLKIFIEFFENLQKNLGQRGLNTQCRTKNQSLSVGTRLNSSRY